MSILDPYGWWGLLGLLIPIIIHLLSKKEKSIVKFGTLRFLQPLESESAKSIQMTQYVLLFLRLLLISLICLLLVSPYYNKEQERISYWVEDSIYGSDDYNQIINEIPRNTSIHQFSHQGSDSADVQFFKSSWTFIDYLNKQPDSAVVYTHSLQKNFIGKLISIEDHIDWKIIPFKEESNESEILFDGQKSTQWTILSTKDKVSVHSQFIENSHGSSTSTLKLKMVSNNFNKEADNIKNIVALSEDFLPYKLEWTISDTDDVWDWQIIISNSNISVDGPTINWSPSERPLFIKVVDKEHIAISGKIDKEGILKTNLPVVIAGEFNKYMTSISSYDKRVLNPKNIISKNDLKSITTTKTEVDSVKDRHPLQSLILLFIVPVFFAERILNYKNSAEA